MGLCASLFIDKVQEGQNGIECATVQIAHVHEASMISHILHGMYGT